jgi:hypothetical protein
MCGGWRLEAAACCTAALALDAGGVVCVWWALILVWGVGVHCSPRPLESRVFALCASGVRSLWQCDFFADDYELRSHPPTSALLLLMFLLFMICASISCAFRVLVTSVSCYSHRGHFQIDGGWIGQYVSCRGVS